MGLLLATDTDTALDLTSELAIAEYTATADTLLRASVRLSGLAASDATFERILRHKTSGDVLIREVFPDGEIQDDKRTAANTVYGFEVGPLFVEAGEKAEVRIKSTNGGDSAVDVQVDWLDAAAIGAGGIDSIEIESGVNLRQALCIMGAMLGGEISGADGATVTIKGMDSATTRLIIVTDEDGNRTSVTLTLPT